jgi:hypothetical protein
MDAALCSLVETDGRFKRASCVHHQGGKTMQLKCFF